MDIRDPREEFLKGIALKIKRSRELFSPKMAPALRMERSTLDRLPIPHKFGNIYWTILHKLSSFLNLLIANRPTSYVT